MPFFNGIKSNEVKSVLTHGYSRTRIKQSLRDDPHLQHFKARGNIPWYYYDAYRATTCLKREITKGSSYCSVVKVAKKVSFVFAASSENVSESPFSVDKEVYTDSRGSFVDMNLIRSDKLKLARNCVTPAYLIIFEINNDSC